MATLNYSGASALVISINGRNHVKDISSIVYSMFKEYGVNKTHVAIQALYDADKIDQNTAGFLLDNLKSWAHNKKKAKAITLL